MRAYGPPPLLLSVRVLVAACLGFLGSSSGFLGSWVPGFLGSCAVLCCAVFLASGSVSGGLGCRGPTATHESRAEHGRVEQAWFLVELHLMRVWWVWEFFGVLVARSG
ncbi:hypothetical protein AOQ84DRAFT_354706 [Glonium stellatum]|uniref:Uncharacterized protein n=1 Tax=Glonium stellatum TaxID=574774 RepID=A0A8E2F034_9PEZI|nr:hypothetical protein AOQ84DRAFT_354706 [Glonium stellatum]